MESGINGGGASMVDGLAIKDKGKGGNVGVRCRGDGVDSHVQVGVKTLGRCGLVWNVRPSSWPDATIRVSGPGFTILYTCSV